MFVPRLSRRTGFFAALLCCAAAPVPYGVAHARQDSAAERDAYAKLPVCRLGPDGRSLELEPCRTAPAQRPMPRRPVPGQDYPQPRIGIPDTTPPPASLPAATLSPYPAAPVPPVRPSVNPQAAQPPSSSPATSPAPGRYAAPPPGPTRPSPTACVGGVCRDATGTPYQGTGTGVLTSPTGRPCTNVGGFIRCM